MGKILIFAMLISLTLWCCTKETNQSSDTPTSGTITITVDEGLKPLIDAEVTVFESLYTKAHIRVIYTSEEEAIDLMLKDTARAAIVTRRLEPAEEQNLREQKYPLRQLKIALDGVALIVNRANQDTVISLVDLKRILNGELQSWNWNHSRKKSTSAGMEVVFDQPNSGIIRYLKDSLIRFDSLPKNWFALKGNEAVIDYVSKHTQALGLIDLSWISDGDDSTANVFLSTIKVMGISNDSGSYKPYQAYIAQKQYPLVREVTMISREGKTGLASGFMSFVAGEKGQRIILKAGLVPATMPVRIVEVNRDPISVSR
ncbi:MAG TPA: substrate-binding domain-containing protein [Chryseolinea sp.]|nr:substrate-binding domain-containing protein [Chryseolinea sp.]